MYQFSTLGLSASESHGIIWFLDFEWNHFVFNMGYLAGLIAITVFIVRGLKKSNQKINALVLSPVIVMMVLEGWHCIEHSLRIYRHITTGCEPCAGIVDVAFGITQLKLHFWFNFFALILPIVSVLWYGMHTRFLRRNRALQTEYLVANLN